MSYMLLILCLALSLHRSTALNTRQIPDDPLLDIFRKQEVLLQKIGKQLNDSISVLDTKIMKLERALASHEKGNKEVVKKMQNALDDIDNLVEDKLCPRGFYLNDFGCYKFINEALPFDTAAARCRQYQSHLVEVQTNKTFEALISLMDQRGATVNKWYHLGAKKVNDVWTWSESKEPFTFNNFWNGGLRGSECAFFNFNHNNKRWDEDHCTYKAHSVCEI